MCILMFAALVQATARDARPSPGRAEARPAPAAIAAAAIAAAPPAAAPPAAAPPAAGAAALPGGDEPGGERARALAALHGRALTSLDAELRARRLVVARISAAGELRAIERPGPAGVAPPAIAVGLPLVEPVADVDVALRYLGDRSPDLRLCALVALRLGALDLSRDLIVVALDAPIADLTVALAAGLRRDVERCATDQHGLAVVVPPAPGARGAP
jgi:hypothetical protein